MQSNIVSLIKNNLKIVNFKFTTKFRSPVYPKLYRSEDPLKLKKGLRRESLVVKWGRNEHETVDG